MDPKTALILTYENYKQGRVSLDEVKKYGRAYAEACKKQALAYTAQNQYAFS